MCERADATPATMCPRNVAARAAMRSDADERSVLEAALAIRAAMDRGNPVTVARAVCRRLIRLVPCTAAGLFLNDGAGDLALASVAGPHRRQARRAWGRRPIAPHPTMSSACVPPLTGAPYTLYVPLKARGKVVGAMVIGCATRPTAADASPVRRLAALLADILERFLLVTTLGDAALAAEQPADLQGTLRAILCGVRRFVPADGAGVLMRDGAQARIIAVDGHPEEAVGHALPIAGDPSLEAPLWRGEPVLLHDLDAASAPESAPGAERIRGYIGAPLVAGGEIIGVLCIDSWSHDAFDDEDLARACRFAAHAGAALARARAQARAQAEIVALREAASLATRDPASGDILPSILDGLRRVIACDGASVLVREGGEARIAAVHGHPVAVLNHRYSISEQATLQKPLLLGQPFLTPDLGAEPGYTPAPGAMDIRGNLSVPLVAHGEVLGMLAVDSLRAGAFGAEDVGRVELFAGYVAAALLNARLHDEVRRSAERDPVTGLYNHRAIHNCLDEELVRARALSAPLAVVMIDVDGFKLYNDTHGHPAGDAALQGVAAALRDACREEDTVGRYGGDEFLVVAPGAAAEDAADLARRLHDAVASHTLRLGGAVLPLRVSAGVATYPRDGVDRDLLVACADGRLYESKNRGGAATVGGDARDTPGLDASSFGVLSGLVTAVDRKDRYTYAHSEQVTRLALLLGQELGLSADTLRSIRLAGLLHDVGKIGVPDRILKKPGPLSADEVETMNSHPALGEAIVAGLPDLAAIRTGVRSHHERWDGRGYPDGLAGEDIPLLGRLLAVPDCYSAMTMDRPYRAALSHGLAMAEIARGAGAQFDPAIVRAFLRAVRAADTALIMDPGVGLARGA